MNMMKPIAIVEGARTPFVKSFGVFAEISAAELGRLAMQDALRRCSLTPEQVDETIFGNVAGPPDTANVARVIALNAGVPEDRIAHTVNRNCASGMESILQGCSAISSGRARTVVAGGTESMSQIPLLFSHDAARVWTRIAKARTLMQRLRAFASFRPRHFKPVAGLELGLTDPVSGLNMGQTAEVLAKEFAITRQEQDTFALNSHQKAAAAQEECFLSGEIISGGIDVSGSKIEKDNGPRQNQTIEQLGKLRPLFDSQGTVTAGNSCPITDGAAAVVLSAPEDLGRFSNAPLGYITAYAIAGCDPKRMGLGPVFATAKLLQQSNYSLEDFELVEINEAFAAQVIACDRAMQSKMFAERELFQSAAIGEIPRDRLNIHGGAIALGHPVGTTGTRLILTLLRSLKAKGLRRGLATLCVGGGQGAAVVVETEMELKI